MKKVLLLIYIISLSSFAKVGDKGNGTDPYKIHAKDFPEPQKLANAITILEKKLSFSNLPTDLKEEVISETEFLEKNGLIKYLGKIVIMSEANEAYGHRIPSEEGVFLGLGGFTLPKKGAQVYFTDRIKSYTVDEFGKNILHEVLHHTLSAFLKDDEIYVEKLTDEVWSGVVSEIALNSLEVGYYLPMEDLSKERFLKAYTMLFKKYEHLMKGGAGTTLIFKNCEAITNTKSSDELYQCFNFLMEKTYYLPSDWASLSVRKVVDEPIWGDFLSYDTYQWSFLRIALLDQGYSLIPRSEDHICKIKNWKWFLIGCLEERKIKDLIAN